MTNQPIGGEFERQYLMLLRELSEIADVKGDRTGVGTRGVFGRMLRCDLSREFPLLTTKKVHLRSIVTELAWFLQGRTDVQWLQERKCTIWDEWATEEKCAKYGRAAGDLGPVYGYQWRSFGAPYKDVGRENLRKHGYVGDGFDQIAWLIEEIKKNPTSRRLLVTAWNPKDAQVVTLPPCHWAFQVQIAKGRLSLMAQLRSCDVFLGLPFNVASYALLTHVLSNITGYEPGDLVMVIGDTHLYANHLEQARLQIARSPRPAPQISYEVNPLIHDGPEGPWRGMIEALKLEDFLLTGYDPHPPIAAPVAV